MAKLERQMHKKSIHDWSATADLRTVEKTIAALKSNGVEAEFVKTKEDAKRKAIAMIPKGSEVMTMSSETLRLSGVVEEIEKSGNFKTVKAILSSGNLDESAKRKLGAAPDYALGSVHAVTEDGRLIIASATGSQLPAYAFGAKKVIWLVGTQKIVKDLDEGMKRLYDYTFPLENERSKKVYGMGSFVSKVLLMNKEFQKDRLFLIFIGESIGF